jgi:hypothetical protein
MPEGHAISCALILLRPVRNTLPADLKLYFSIFCYHVFLKILTKWRLFLHIAFTYFFFRIIFVRYGQKLCTYKMIQEERKNFGRRNGR